MGNDWSQPETPCAEVSSPFDPRRAAKGGTSLRIDVGDVDLALRAWKGEDTSAQSATGWDQSFPMPDSPNR